MRIVSWFCNITRTKTKEAKKPMRSSSRCRMLSRNSQCRTSMKEKRCLWRESDHGRLRGGTGRHPRRDADETRHHLHQRPRLESQYMRNGDQEIVRQIPRTGTIDGRGITTGVRAVHRLHPKTLITSLEVGTKLMPKKRFPQVQGVLDHCMKSADHVERRIQCGRSQDIEARMRGKLSSLQLRFGPSSTQDRPCRTSSPRQVIQCCLLSSR